MLFIVTMLICFMGQTVALAQQQRVTNLDASGTIASTGVYRTSRKHPRNDEVARSQTTEHIRCRCGLPGVTVWAVPAGSNISCNNGDIVLTDRVEITGTAGDAFRHPSNERRG